MRTITIKYRGENKNLYGSIQNYKAYHCELYNSGGKQFYNYNDISVNGDIFDFTHKYKESDRIIFKEEADGSFTPCNWYDIPSDGEERKRFIFVYDVVEYQGEDIALYDYFS